MTLLAGAATPANAAASPGGRILSVNASDGNSPGELRSARPDGTGMTDLGHEIYPLSSPDYSPDGTLIVYDGVHFTIRTMKADGTDDQRIADAPCGPSRSRWSPDGRWIAFESCGDIWKLSSQGYPGGYFNLSNNLANSSPDWGPLGRRLAAPAEGTIRIYRADGSGWRVLTDLPRASDVAWNPRSTTIAVMAMGDLWFVDAVTGAKRQLTDTPDVVESHPVWSPDGRWLAYASGGVLPPPPPDEQPPPEPPTPVVKDPQIWLMTAAGSQRHSTGVAGIPTSWRAQD
ncbi:TolB family protein [Actinoplanes sp. CA-030573]|uniref:TolB family protein n=1 Tax=Actinoplanes sp. CA-030573 TaxID=3239898 RepID=UPI003D8C8B34